MTATPVGPDDLDWLVGVLKRRRESLVGFAPEFWRPAPDASVRHRAFLAYLVSEGGAKAFRTDRSVLVAALRHDGWLIDDAHVPGPDWAAGDGRTLWNALDAAVHAAPVRFVCPTHEEDRAEFARAAGLSLAESWWLHELPGVSGGAPDVAVPLAGADAVTVAAPPVYAPRGPVLFLPAVTDTDTALPEAVAQARRLGCPAVVVNHVAGDDHDPLAEALAGEGFRRHCDYYTGVVASL